MPRRTAFSAQTLAVLAALAARPSDWRHGYDLARETGLKSGTLYPILVRLADREIVAGLLGGRRACRAAQAPPVPAHHRRAGGGDDRTGGGACSGGQGGAVRSGGATGPGGGAPAAGA